MAGCHDRAHVENRASATLAEELTHRRSIRQEHRRQVQSSVARHASSDTSCNAPSPHARPDPPATWVSARRSGRTSAARQQSPWAPCPRASRYHRGRVPTSKHLLREATRRPRQAERHHAGRLRGKASGAQRPMPLVPPTTTIERPSRAADEARSGTTASRRRRYCGIRNFGVRKETRMEREVRNAESKITTDRRNNDGEAMIIRCRFERALVDLTGADVAKSRSTAIRADTSAEASTCMALSAARCRGFGCRKLGHGRLGARQRSEILSRGSLPRQQARRLEFGRHVRHEPLHRLVFRDRPAERLTPLQCAMASCSAACPTPSDCAAMPTGRPVERPARQADPAIDLPRHIVGRNVHIVEKEVHPYEAAHAEESGPDVCSGRDGRMERERRDPAARAHRVASPRTRSRRRPLRRWRPRFASGQPPAVTVCGRDCFLIGSIGARVLFGEREDADRLSRDESREPARLLVWPSEPCDTLVTRLFATTRMTASVALARATASTASAALRWSLPSPPCSGEIVMPRRPQRPLQPPDRADSGRIRRSRMPVGRRARRRSGPPPTGTLPVRR